MEQKKTIASAAVAELVECQPMHRGVTGWVVSIPGRGVRQAAGSIPQ